MRFRPVNGGAAILKGRRTALCVEVVNGISPVLRRLRPWCEPFFCRKEVLIKISGIAVKIPDKFLYFCSLNYHG